MVRITGIIIAVCTAGSFIVKGLIMLYKSARMLEKVYNTQPIILRGLLAIFDGFEQLNCNGPITSAKQELEKYLTEH